MSSYQKLRPIMIKPNEVRDFFQSLGKATDQTIDLFQQYMVCGLDIFVRNKGASSLTVSIDKQTAITVDAGDVFSWDNIKFSLVEIVSSVAYDFVVAGIHIAARI